MRFYLRRRDRPTMFDDYRVEQANLRFDPFDGA
jgi:hypothetical protein